MPHQCVKCNKIYEDASEELLKGCTCGGKFFFFVRKKDIEEAQKITINLTSQDKEEIEKDVKEIIGKEFDETKPVILDLESIRVLKPGKYELDLVELFQGKPLVYRLEDGKYFIDIAASLGKH